MMRTAITVMLMAIAISFGACEPERSVVRTSPAPASPKRPVTDDYYGTKVTDDYRWLEDFNDLAVKEWIEEQNQCSRTYFEKLTTREAILNRLKELHNRSAAYGRLVQRGDLLFAMKDQPPKNHPVLVVMTSADDSKSERVVVDSDQINSAVPTEIDWYRPSLDGRLVAVSLSENGSEDGSIHVYESRTGKKLADVIPRAQYATAGGDATWNADGTGFWYTRYPQGSERPRDDLNFYQQAYFHKLGTPSTQDTYVIGKEFPRIAEITFQTTRDGRYLLATVANGDGGEFAHYLMNPQGTWTQVTQFSDKVVAATLEDGKLYLLSRQAAPQGKILAVTLANPRLSEAVTIVPVSDAVIDYFKVSIDRLFVVDLVGGPHQVRTFDLTGATRGAIPIRPVSSVSEMVTLDDGTLLYGNESFVDPPAFYRFDPKTGQSVKTALAVTTPADFGDTEVVRDFAASKDGTKVPISVIRRKGTKLDGQNPTLLYGYGGYNISLTPYFSDELRLWIEQGGVYAVANIRGGGEFGEEWHLAGSLTRKQNAFDDFAACASYLIEQKYTNPARLAIRGESNGGLLIGATVTQHPEMFKAAISLVGIYDMLRVELSPNGTFNTTEFGTVKDQNQFNAMFAYSPYHNVKDGISYPAVLMTTGDNDARVDPMQSRKMIARLQAATASKLPVLLETSSSAGHGIGTSLDERLAQDADVYSFLFDQLGIKYQAAR
jgi:prolyl oligopeptidase